MIDIHIRHAGPGDDESIARLLHQLGYPVDGADVPGRITRMLRDDRVAVFLAERGPTVVGLATAHILSVINRPRDVAWLTTLVVDEACRGTGVGRRLVDAVVEFGRAANCERVSVTTHEDRAGAQAFYARIGFTLTGRRFGLQIAEP